MEKTLVIFAHPYLEYSQSNKELLNFYVRHHHCIFRDLYEEYPDFHIPAFRERKRLKNFDRIIFHFPLIWFGIPPLLKLWIDEVFDQKWQMESEENPLANKEAIILVTTNFSEVQFQRTGTFRFTINELISGLIVALEQNNIEITQIFKIYNVDSLSKKQIVEYKQKFQEFLKR